MMKICNFPVRGAQGMDGMRGELSLEGKLAFAMCSSPNNFSFGWVTLAPTASNFKMFSKLLRIPGWPLS